MEELKKKFIQKLQESEAKVDATIGKMVALDKARGQAHAAAEALKEEIEKVEEIYLSLNVELFYSAILKLKA